MIFIAPFFLGMAQSRSADHCNLFINVKVKLRLTPQTEYLETQWLSFCFDDAPLNLRWRATFYKHKCERYVVLWRARLAFGFFAPSTTIRVLRFPSTQVINHYRN
jgi:hypothetical protein